MENGRVKSTVTSAGARVWLTLTLLSLVFPLDGFLCLLRGGDSAALVWVAAALVAAVDVAALVVAVAAAAAAAVALAAAATAEVAEPAAELLPASSLVQARV